MLLPPKAMLQRRAQRVRSAWAPRRAVKSVDFSAPQRTVRRCPCSVVDRRAGALDREGDLVAGQRVRGTRMRADAVTLLGAPDGPSSQSPHRMAAWNGRARDRERRSSGSLVRGHRRGGGRHAARRRSSADVLGLERVSSPGDLLACFPQGVHVVLQSTGATIGHEHRETGDCRSLGA